MMRASKFMVKLVITNMINIREREAFKINFY
jgi:hypothetical protein